MTDLWVTDRSIAAEWVRLNALPHKAYVEYEAREQLILDSWTESLISRRRDDSIAAAGNCAIATAADSSIATAGNCAIATATDSSIVTASDSSAKGNGSG